MANAVTSRTSPVAAGVVSHLIKGSKEGVACYLKYTKGNGTSISMQFTFINKDIDLSDEYKPIYLSNGTPAVLTYVFLTSGNYRIPIPLAKGETTIKATVTFNDGSNQQAVLDFYNE